MAIADHPGGVCADQGGPFVGPLFPGQGEGGPQLPEPRRKRGVQMNWIPIAISVGKGVAELIAAIAEMAGESTETVRDRVIAELAGPQGDATDSVADAIDAALPDSSDR